MSYSALAKAPSPYKTLQQPVKPSAGKTTSLTIDKFHALLCEEAITLSNSDAIMESYKRFHRQETKLIWYFTQVSILAGAVKRPQLPAKNDPIKLWVKSWNDLSNVSRQVICDLGGQDAQTINLESSDTRDKLVAGLANWPAGLFASGQGAETAKTGATCSVFVGEALCQTARRLKLPDNLFLRADKEKNRIVNKFIGAQNFRKIGVFEAVLGTEIKPGHIASMSNGGHVEIITRLENDQENFCSIGAGRLSEDDYGKVLCGSADWFWNSRREINNSSSMFLRLKPDHQITKRIVKAMKGIKL